MNTSRGATVAEWWPWLVLPAAATSLVAVGLTLALVDRGENWLAGEAWVNVPLAIGFSTVAAGIWATGPHSVGVRRLALLYTVVGIGAALVIPAFGWTRVDLPGSAFTGWLSNWVWSLGAAPLLGLGLVLYPDGRLPSRRWWPAVVLGICGPLGLLTANALTRGELENHPTLDNPVGILSRDVSDAVGAFGFISLMTAALIGLVALAVKFRRAPAGTDVRGQIGGFAVAGLVLVVVASQSTGTGVADAVLTLAVATVLPLTVGVAVVRHRLLDQRADLEGLHRRVDTLSASRRELVNQREDERVRLRRELHDGLGPSLASIGLGLRQLEQLPGQDETVRALADEVQQAVSEVRRICEGLRPAALNELGLAGALTEALRPLERFGPHMRIDIAELPRVSPAVEVAAYRIVMEAATNATRHADASCVQVRIGYDDGLVVRVTDDGRGIDPAARPGIGLAAMAERADEIGGRLAVSAPPGGGTVVEAWLPEGADE